MSKGKRFAQYLFFLIVVLLLIYWGTKYGLKLKLTLKETYSIADTFQYYIVSAVFPILFGLVLGIPAFLRKLQQQGKWVIDWMKLLVIGVPTLLLDLSMLFYSIVAFYAQDKVGFFIRINPFFQVMTMDNRVITLSGIVFGYILICSLTKESSDIN
ncbi:hypothetical protein ACHOLT_09200 [Desulfitobacterium sp. Sab5]|uniref:hypothetical protein n=1 Tax=Desulfitobacterium nosdiversum TaxID=3375356 RepID=UPI003CF16032